MNAKPDARRHVALEEERNGTYLRIVCDPHMQTLVRFSHSFLAVPIPKLPLITTPV